MKSITLLGIISLILLAAVVLLFKNAVAAGPIKVFVIDTGIDYTHRVFDNRTIVCETSKDCKDRQGHGTAITSLIINGELNEYVEASTPICKSVKIEMCNYEPYVGEKGYYDCLDRAIKAQPDVINFSSVGSFPSQYEYSQIRFLTERGIKFVAATGNEGRKLEMYPNFPIMYIFPEKLLSPFNKLLALQGIVAVGATEGDSVTMWKQSNTVQGMVTEKGVNLLSAVPGQRYVKVTGTSAAAALRTNRIIRQLCQERGY